MYHNYRQKADPYECVEMAEHRIPAPEWPFPTFPHNLASVDR
ncbi:EspF repeat-containing protein [Cohnella cholangitidis]|uniref:Uncharacterized protein n=1 Tax=Cohnella cholangitidis TaxID=2598458 RepID=A0A7G5C116_9BACL|nr:hypothetical protein FPL14_18200 [Cohnella cholangitidis]